MNGIPGVIDEALPHIWGHVDEELKGKYRSEGFVQSIKQPMRT